MITSARSTGVLAAVAAVLVGSTVSAPGASAASRTATAVSHSVTGFCSFAGGFQTNIVGTVDTMRVTVRQPKRPGGKLKVRVFVQQHQQTPRGQSYPAKILRGQVVVKVAGKHYRLNGPVNSAPVEGTIFPNGWTAKGSIAAPAKSRYKVVVKRVVYNVRGGGSGTWGRAHRGFDLVCSGGINPEVRSTTYSAPVVRVRATVR